MENIYEDIVGKSDSLTSKYELGGPPPAKRVAVCRLPPKSPPPPPLSPARARGEGARSATYHPTSATTQCGTASIAPIALPSTSSELRQFQLLARVAAAEQARKDAEAKVCQKQEQAYKHGFHTGKSVQYQHTKQLEQAAEIQQLKQQLDLLTRQTAWSAPQYTPAFNYGYNPYGQGQPCYYPPQLHYPPAPQTQHRRGKPNKQKRAALRIAKQGQSPAEQPK